MIGAPVMKDLNVQLGNNNCLKSWLQVLFNPWNLLKEKDIVIMKVSQWEIKQTRMFFRWNTTIKPQVDECPRNAEVVYCTYHKHSKFPGQLGKVVEGTILYSSLQVSTTYGHWNIRQAIAVECWPLCPIFDGIRSRCHFYANSGSAPLNHGS